jgi:hypothetical protein
LAEFQPQLVVALAVVAYVVCWIWRKTIAFYSSLFAIKFQILQELEGDFGAKPYTLELEKMKAAGLEPLTKNDGRGARDVGDTLGSDWRGSVPRARA